MTPTSIRNVGPTRERRRARVLTGGVITTVVNRAVYALVPILAIPVGLSQLGVEGFGAWVTALSIASLIAFADLGIGTGLMTRLGAGADVGNVSPDARRYVSSAYALVSTLAFTCIALLFLSGVLLDWASILNAQDESSNVELILLITISSFICNIVASLIVRIQYGVGQQAKANLWQACGNLAMLIAIYAVAEYSQSISLFVATAAYAPVLIAITNSALFFTTNAVGRQLSPRLHSVGAEEIATLFGLGRRFVLISLLMAIGLAMDPYIVARTTQLETVPEYAIPYRIFALIGGISVMLALPLWPLHARAVHAGDVAWIRSITRRMSLLCVALAICLSVAAFMLAPRAIELWLPESTEIRFHFWFWLGLSAWWVAQTLASPSFMVQNGAAILRPQTIAYAISLLAIPVKWLVSENFGYQWIPWIGLAFYCVVVWPACLRGYRQSIQLAEYNASCPAVGGETR